MRTSTTWCDTDLSTYGGVDQGIGGLCSYCQREYQRRDRRPGYAGLALDLDYSAGAVGADAVEPSASIGLPSHMAPCGLVATPSNRVAWRLTVMFTLNPSGVVSLMDSNPVSSTCTGIALGPGSLKS
jgi:hypothetical protein